jgi:histone acetyltransferase (RNA polymerase elongator complex component)
VFIPHGGCPHRCLFCNQALITGSSDREPDEAFIRSQVDLYRRFRGKRSKIVLAFFGGNFLGLEQGARARLLGIARSLADERRIDAVRFSTRPDTVTRATLAGLGGSAVETVELGVQSMDDRVLTLSHRGHTARHTRLAAGLLREAGLEIGMQMMVGMPGDTDLSLMETAMAMAELHPAFVRIYPLLVLRGSPLHRLWEQGLYLPMDLAHCVTLVKGLYDLFTLRGIRVVRMGLQASDLLQGPGGVTAGPWHPAFGHLVHSERFLDKALALLEENPPTGRKDLTLLVHPRSEARLRGERNRNLAVLASRYPGSVLTVRTDPGLDLDTLGLRTGE